MAEENDSKYELLDRFRADLKRPLSERYYSEDELVAIFDYAGDEFDDYVRTEVLLLGMRLYPDSAELLSRRAIFYRDYDPGVFHDFLDDNAAAGSDSLMALMRLSSSSLSGEEAEAALDDFLLTHSLSDDEEVIRLVQTAHELEADSWLVRNLKRIREKVEYLPSLLYEIAILSNVSEEFDKIAEASLEELTEMEPYAPEYWTMLGLVYVRHGRMAEARSAVDYALAIDPEYVEALKVRLRTFDGNEPSDEANEIIERIGMADPDDQQTAFVRICHREGSSTPEEINEFIDSLSPNAKLSPLVVMKALEFGNRNVEEMLRELYESGHTDAESWREMAEYAYVNNNMAGLRCVVDVHEKLSGTKMDISYITLRMLYDIGRYEDGINLFVNSTPGSEVRQPRRMAESYARYIMMLLRLGRTAEAENAATAVLDVIRTEGGVAPSPIENYGMKVFASDVVKRIRSIRKTNWAKYDPLGFGE